MLTRYEFPGRRLLDAAVDLPFALPTAVAGISLAAIYAPNGWIGALLAPLGGSRSRIRRSASSSRSFSSGCPSSCAPCSRVIAELDAGSRGGRGHARRDAAADLLPRDSAGPAPALLTGFALAFARAVGEYGSVIFIAGNLPFVSEIAPLADRHQAGAVRLRRRDRDRRR